MGLRFNPPPGWPAPPEGFTPPPGWQPDPSWPPPPPGWQLWVEDEVPPAGPGAGSWSGPSGWQPDMSGQPGQQAAAAERGFPPPQPGTPPGYSPDAAPGRPAGRGTNGFAIASFIFGLIGGILLGVIFGIIALSQIRRRQQGGRGLAIAGLVLSGVWTVVAAAAIIAGVALTAHRSGTGQITKGGTVSIFSLRVGDCFQNPPGGSQLTVQTVTAVPCSTPHNAQTFAAFTATGTSYPGTAALIRQAGQGCQARVAGDLDRSKLTRTMSLRFLFPERQSWSDGRRTITCLVEDSSADLTSSLLAAHPAG